VNISSRPKQAQAYTTSEFGKILKYIKTLKREVTRFGETNQNIEYNKIIKKFEELEQSIYKHSKQLNYFEQALNTAASTKLTKKQITILKWLIEQYQGSEVYTNLIQKISHELEIPESTVRWNMRRLREADFIEAGTKENKGLLVTLTTKGRIMANFAEPMD
jgi:hypothetical protein